MTIYGILVKTYEELMTLTTNDDVFAKQLVELENIQNLCKKLLTSSHYKNIGEAGIHAIIARAKALGIHPFEALNGGFHCINGKVGMSTEMMAALVRQKGHSITKDPKSTNECVILVGKRKDTGDEWISKFDKQDAINAGLWGTSTWKKYPEIMLYNRAMSKLFRQLFPDLSLGAGYVEDELKEIAKTEEYAETAKLPEADVQVSNVIEQNIEEVPPKIEHDKISSQQIAELTDLFETCEQKYKDKFFDGLNHLGIKRFDQIPQDLYSRIKNALLKNQINSDSVIPE